MTYGVVAAVTAAVGAVAFTIIFAVTTRPWPAAAVACFIALAVPAILLTAGLIGLVWDRWLEGR
jgi:uncharacterized membrane protein YjjB (DUF3815 family)